MLKLKAKSERLQEIFGVVATLMHEVVEKYPGSSVAKSASKMVRLLGRKLKK